MKDYTIYYDLQEKFNLTQKSELLSVKFQTNIERLYEFYIQNKNTVETTSMGWGTDANSINSKDLKKSGVLVAKRQTIKDKGLYEENFKTLNAFLSQCNKRNIEVVLITFPRYKSITSKLEKNQLETTIKAVNHLKKNSIIVVIII
jgi:hypothetical protein